MSWKTLLTVYYDSINIITFSIYDTACLPDHLHFSVSKFLVEMKNSIYDDLYTSRVHCTQSEIISSTPRMPKILD